MLLLGGTSDIGRAVGLYYAGKGCRVLLAARNVDAVARNAQDIATRTGCPVPIVTLDILETGRFGAVLDGLPLLPDSVVCVVGELGDQRRAEVDLDHASIVIRTNFEGPALFLGLVAERFAARGSGTIVGVSSVAGDRGRGSNYVYGASKAALTAFLSGLRNRLAPSGVRVVTVKPGFVRTRMTAHMKLPGILTAEPDEVAIAVFRADADARRDVVYVRPIWRFIMAAIRLIPESIFKRLRL
jgi:decaprenylphospho-beta-D-erythro-pentofuranosid-2-ulose 2-reductase